MNAIELAARLPDVKQHGEWYEAHCRAHDDRRRSFGFRDGDRGIIVKCHAGCTIEQIAAALDLRVADLFYENGAANQKRIVTTYAYRDENGRLLYETVRYHPKDFRQRRPDGQGGWVWNLKGVRPVLYRLADLLKADRALIVEGEKDAETAYQLGVPDGTAATCNPMGAGKWRSAYSESLQGKRVVILLAIVLLLLVPAAGYADLVS